MKKGWTLVLVCAIVALISGSSFEAKQVKIRAEKAIEVRVAAFGQ